MSPIASTLASWHAPPGAVGEDAGVDEPRRSRVADEEGRNGQVDLAAKLKNVPNGQQVTVAGVVTHRQRPETANGTTFINLEDETGLINIICPPGVWARHRRAAQQAPAMIVHGRAEAGYRVVNVVAETIEPLKLAAGTQARNFR